MGYLLLNTGLISSFTVERINESENYSVIHLSIHTDVSSVSYRICADTRQPNLDDIYEDLKNTLELVMNEEDSYFKINEYLERNYVFITYPDGRIAQYTANKI